MLSRSPGWKWKASEPMRAGGVETQGPAPLIWRTRVTCATPLRLMAYLCGGAQSNPNFDVQEAEEGGVGSRQQVLIWLYRSVGVDWGKTSEHERLADSYKIMHEVIDFLDKGLCITIKPCSGSIFIVRALQNQFTHVLL